VEFGVFIRQQQADYQYKFHLIGGRRVSWNKGANEPHEDFIFFYGIENANHLFETDFSMHQVIRSEVKRAEFFNDRIH